MSYRKLSSEEVIALTTINCCVNAFFDKVPHLERRLKRSGMGRLLGLAKGAAKVISKVVQVVIEEAPDEDQRAMILTRMSRLQLQFGVVRKHPENLIIMTQEDAETLIAPVLEKCDLECPCISEDDEGNRFVNAAMVKGCEIRKALVRSGVSENGLGSECPYQFVKG